jgi:hypothetical protein
VLSTALQRHLAKADTVSGMRALPQPTAGLPWAAGQPVVVTRSLIDGGEGDVRLDFVAPGGRLEHQSESDVFCEVVLPWRKGAEGGMALEDARRARVDVATLRAAMPFDAELASAETESTALRAVAVASDAARRAVAAAPLGRCARGWYRVCHHGSMAPVTPPDAVMSGARPISRGCLPVIC